LKQIFILNYDEQASLKSGEPFEIRLGDQSITLQFERKSYRKKNGEGEGEALPFPCTVEECGRSFKTKQGLSKHESAKKHKPKSKNGGKNA
jgi:hypothetical protein